MVRWILEPRLIGHWSWQILACELLKPDVSLGSTGVEVHHCRRLLIRGAWRKHGTATRRYETPRSNDTLAWSRGRPAGPRCADVATYYVDHYARGGGREREMGGEWGGLDTPGGCVSTLTSPSRRPASLSIHQVSTMDPLPASSGTCCFFCSRTSPIRDRTAQDGRPRRLLIKIARPRR